MKMDNKAPKEAAGTKSSKNSVGWILVTSAIGGFMPVLDSGVVNLILPNLSKYFRTSLSTIEWTTMAYLLVISGLVITLGRFGDLYGHKKIYLGGYIVFTVASLLCGLASSVWMLIIFRGIQAIGGGMLMAMAPAIITGNVPAAARGRALSVSAVAMGVGTILGPLLGGILTTNFGWRSVFMINIPVGIIGFWMAQRTIPDQAEHAAASESFDLGGAALILFSLTAILLPLSLVENYSWGDPWILLSLGVGIVSAIGFIYYELQQTHPLLDLDLFRNRIFLMGNISISLFYMAQYTILLLIPFYLQDLRGLTAQQASYLYVPMPIIIILVSPLSGYLSDRMDSRYISAAGMAIMAFGIWQLSNLKVDSAYIYMILGASTLGLGSGLFLTPNNSAVMGSIPKSKQGVASGMLAMMKYIGMVLGVAVSGAVFTSLRQWLTLSLKTQAIQSVPLSSVAFEGALHITYLVGAAFAVIAVLTSLIKGSTKDQLTGQNDNMTEIKQAGHNFEAGEPR
ncbi:MAG TPA: MFS transporter [Anaerolineales bacterium]|nr:MFS transporter [Anaerolineales bacterium]